MISFVSTAAAILRSMRVCAIPMIALIPLTSACDDEQGSGSQIEPDLVGSWYAGTGGLSAPYDTATGSWGTPSGQGLVLQLASAGTYVRAYQSYNSAGGCTNGFTAFETGTVEAVGDTIRLHARSGHLKVSDSCAPSLDSDRPIAADQLHNDVYEWSPLDAGPSQIRIVDQNGNWADFRKL